MADYRSEVKDGVHIITCPAIMEATDNTLEAMVKSWLITETEIHILDFKDVTEVKQTCYRPLLQFNQGLKQNGKKLFCMNVSKTVQPKMNQDGLSSVFVSVKSVEEAVQLVKAKAGAAKSGIDVEFINPFITATQTVLETQASTPVKPGKPYAKKPQENLPMEIAGVISLTNPHFTGSISLCFKADVFLKIYENMVGEKHDKITPEIEDAAGELLNIIFGTAKTILNDQKGYTLEKAIPSILSGEKLTLRHQSSAPVILLPFESPAGLFHLEVLVERG